MEVDWRSVPCKLWSGSLQTGGYGQRKVNGVHWLAHRYAWYEAYGPIPEGMLVCHHCDVPACIELAHLFLGTHQDNMTDMAEKGRSTGVRMDRETERLIRIALRSDLPLYRVMQQVGVSKGQLYRMSQKLRKK